MQSRQIHPDYWEQYLAVVALGARSHATQLFDKHPYSFHLRGTERILEEHGYCPPTKEGFIRRAICWLHDATEDSDLTYNDVYRMFGDRVANPVYLLQEYKGRSPKERKPPAYWLGIKTEPDAVLTKLADRTFNVEYGKNPDKIRNYAAVQPVLRQYLYTPGQYDDLWERLDNAIKNI